MWLTVLVENSDDEVHHGVAEINSSDNLGHPAQVLCKERTEEGGLDDAG